MKSALKKVASLALAALLVLSGAGTASAVTPSPSESVEPQKQTSVKAEKTSTGLTVTVDTKKDGTAVVNTIAKTNQETVKVSSTVTVDGVKYKVTTIEAGAFKNATKAKTIALPNTITKIGAKAFSGASKSLKKVKIASKKAPTIAKNAFKGTNTKQMTIKVNKQMTNKQLKKLKKQLKAAGFKGKVSKASN